MSVSDADVRVDEVRQAVKRQAERLANVERAVRRICETVSRQTRDAAIAIEWLDLRHAIPDHDAPAPEPEEGRWYVLGAGFRCWWFPTSQEAASKVEREGAFAPEGGPYLAIFAPDADAARKKYAEQVAGGDAAQGEDAAKGDELLYAVANLIGWAEVQTLQGHRHRVEARDTIVRLVWTDPDYKPLSLNLARALFARVASKQGDDVARLTRERDEAREAVSALEWARGRVKDRAESAEAEVERLRAIGAWLLGEAEGEDFPERPVPVDGKPYPWYWWRKELRARLAAASRGEAV